MTVSMRMGIFGVRQASGAKSAIMGALSAAIVMLPATAFSASNIYSPTVEKGELEIELKGVVEFDDDPATDGKSKIYTGVGYGFTDYLFAEVTAEWEKEPGESYVVEGIELEAIFQLTQPGEYWADFGAVVEYAIANRAGDLDKFEIKPIIQKQIGRTIHTINLGFEKQIGSGADGWEFEYAWASRWRLSPYFEPGIEIYGEIGELEHIGPLKDQEHLMGPVVIGTLPLEFGPGKIHYEVGYLFGLTNDSPDGALRWMLEYEIYF